MGSGEAGQAQETNLGANTQETDPGGLKPVSGSGGVRRDQVQDPSEGLTGCHVYLCFVQKKNLTMHVV